MLSLNTTLVHSLGLRIGPACEAGLSTGMRRERVPPQIRKKERNEALYRISSYSPSRNYLQNYQLQQTVQ